MSGSVQIDLRMTSDSESEMSFEVALEKLEKLVDSMESGDVPLDELVAKFEQGTRLLGHCQKRLEIAEIKIEQVKKSSQGRELEDFPSDKGS